MHGLMTLLVMGAILPSALPGATPTAGSATEANAGPTGFVLTIAGEAGTRFEATCHVQFGSGTEEHFILGSAPLVQTLPGTGIECRVRVLSPGGSLTVGLQRKAGGAIMRSQVTGAGSQIVLRQNN